MPRSRLNVRPCSLDVPASRREFLARAGGGMGAIALAALLSRRACGRDEPDVEVANPLAARDPDFEPRAKRVVWLFMDGGPSHIDLFDHKPELQKYAGHRDGRYQRHAADGHAPHLRPPWPIEHVGQ
jgi:hypothetical protein